jgi:hypothetical protein
MELLLIIIGVLLLLLSMFMVSTLERAPKENIMPDSAIAAAKLIDDIPADIELATRPPSLKLLKNVSAAPLLKGGVKATVLETSLTNLIEHPSRVSEIPAGTELLGVTVRNNVVTVDLSEKFSSGGGAASMLGRVEEVRKTVQRLHQNYKLKLAINGKLVPYLGGEGLEVNQ